MNTLAATAVPAEPDAVRRIARNLRMADRAELAAVHGHDVDLALLLRMRRAEAAAHFVFVMVIGILLGLVGTLRTSPVGPLVAGLLVGWQQAVNGQVRQVAGSAFTATFGTQPRVTLSVQGLTMRRVGHRIIIHVTFTNGSGCVKTTKFHCLMGR